MQASHRPRARFHGMETARGEVPPDTWAGAVLRRLAPSLCARGLGPGSRRGSAPGRTRTCDLRFRRPLLYPAELPGHACQAVPREGRMVRAASDRLRGVAGRGSTPPGSTEPGCRAPRRRSGSSRRGAAGSGDPGDRRHRHRPVLSTLRRAAHRTGRAGRAPRCARLSCDPRRMVKHDPSGPSRVIDLHRRSPGPRMASARPAHGGPARSACGG